MTRSSLILGTAAALAATLALHAPAARAQGGGGAGPDRLTICGGVRGGTYATVAGELARRLAGAFPAGVAVLDSESQPASTRGSMDNLNHLAARRCDLAVAQSDVRDAFLGDHPEAVQDVVELNGQLYREYVHLVCPVDSGWTRVNHVGQAAKDGKRARIVVGPPGTGTEVSWRMMRKADPALYDAVERLPDPPGITSLAAVRSPGSGTCMLWISGLNPPVMQSANRMSTNTQGGKASLRLVNFDDRDIRGLKAPSGRPVYEQVTIEKRAAGKDGQGGAYTGLIDGSSVSSLAVNAVLLTHREFRDRLGPQRLERIAEALEDAGPTIRAQAGAR
jgi:NMT1-like family